MNSGLRDSRRGYALVELVVVISVGSLIGTAAAVLLGMLLAADRGSRRHLHESHTLCRLAQAFRADAAAAERAKLEPAPPGDGKTSRQAAARLQFSLPGGESVTYVAEPGRVLRRQSGGLSADRQESFVLPDSPPVQLGVETGPTFSVARLQWNSGQDARRARSGWRIEATVGRDRRREETLRRAPGTVTQEKGAPQKGDQP